MNFTLHSFLKELVVGDRMSIESSVGRVTRDVTQAISDATCSNLVGILRNEMNLNNDQISKIFSVVRSSVENTGLNAVNQYVSLINDVQSESSPAPKKGKLFG